jgi:hypothetical protein
MRTALPCAAWLGTVCCQQCEPYLPEPALSLHRLRSAKKHNIITLKEDEEPEAGLLLLRQMVSPALAACMVKTLDTLLGYHHTHLQRSQVPSCLNTSSCMLCCVCSHQQPYAALLCACAMQLLPDCLAWSLLVDSGPSSICGPLHNSRSAAMS